MSSGDKAALLAAINSAVAAPKSQTKTDKIKVAKSLAQGSGVNTRVAHDLVSNASRANEVADQRDFQNAQDNKNTNLNKDQLSQMNGGNSKGEIDLRSVKSEYDYGSKRKFTDVLGEPNKAQQLARLQNEY